MPIASISSQLGYPADFGISTGKDACESRSHDSLWFQCVRRYTQAYHSIFLQDQDVRIIGMLSLPSPLLLLQNHICCSQLTGAGNIALLPLRTRTRGPAYALPPLPASTAAIDVDPDSESYDPLDEVLSLFRANTFFRNFEIKGPADRLLIYGILFVSECLGKVRSTMGSREAEKVS